VLLRAAPPHSLVPRLGSDIPWEGCVAGAVIRDMPLRPNAASAGSRRRQPQPAPGPHGLELDRGLRHITEELLREADRRSRAFALPAGAREAFSRWL